MLQIRLVKYLKQCFSTSFGLRAQYSICNWEHVACLYNLAAVTKWHFNARISVVQLNWHSTSKLNIGIEDILTSWSTIYFAAWLYDQSLDSSTSKDRSCFGIYIFNKEFSVLNTSFFQLDMLLLHIIVRPRELNKWCLRFMICDFMICSCVFGHLFTFEVCM